ncbi:hypothetical protein QL285_066809 [Trifolium repens]|nr:hypothetical protein QL285_066809 [Trifolium repens]
MTTRFWTDQGGWLAMTKEKKSNVGSKKPLSKRTKISLIKSKHVRRILAKRKFFARLRMTMFKRYIQRRKVELNTMKFEIMDEKLEIMDERMEIMVERLEIMNEKLEIMNEKLEIMVEKLEIMNEKIHLLNAMWERKQQLKEEIRQLCYQKYLLTLASLVVQQFLQENDSEEEESAQEEEENEDEEEEDDEDDDEDGDE